MLVVHGLGRVEPPKGGLVTLPTTPPPLVSGSAREVSDLAVSLNIAGVVVNVSRPRWSMFPRLSWSCKVS